jgi:cyclic beta-1,2-glucan synthetase
MLKQDDNILEQENPPSSERHLAAQAEELAKLHSKTDKKARVHDLLKRVQNQEAFLSTAYQAFQNQTEEESVQSFAAEWILDNYYIIQRTLRMIKEELPIGYYRQLPKLSQTPLHGYPRTFAISLAIIKQREGRLDETQIRQFVFEYQETTPLTMGEVWAIPIMLRIGIIECLCQAVARSLPETPESFEPITLIGLEDVPNDTLIGSCIVSLRSLDVLDWKEFFEAVSLVEQILVQDPAQVYHRMDFETRDGYRQVIERLSAASGKSEIETALTVVHLSKEFAETNGRSPRRSHIGYYLIAEGRSQLETRIGVQPSILKSIGRWLMGHPSLIYLSSVLGLSMLILAGITAYLIGVEAAPGGFLAALLLAILPAVTISIALTNWAVTQVIKPKLLPKIDFEDGIPADCRTMVVVPALLSSPDEVKDLLNQLQLHYLQNSSANVHFALLTDFSDAPEQHLPEDEELLALACSGIDSLNQRYVADTNSAGAAFSLLHRERRWNSKMGTWMGWERKRGKLHEFNQLLLGKQNTSFQLIHGDLSGLRSTRYVITLDADTVMPRGAARRLIGCLAHPLNQAGFDPKTGKVRSGYTVLQPRTEIKPSSANRTFFTRIYSGDIGIDLYTHAVSDLYQDLFGEGIYVGKGIYDVEAFERSLEHSVPENALLSHDLFEGILGRVGLVTDITLYEEYPPGYFSFTQRMERWVRGDWQLLPWLFPIPMSKQARSKFNLIDYWKIIDNLRRSLVVPAVMLLILAGWLILPGSASVWTSLALLTLGVPLIIPILSEMAAAVRDRTVSSLAHAIQLQFTRWLLAITLLPYEAVLITDAILTTIYRLLFIQRNLLKWTTAAHSASLFGEGQNSLKFSWQKMTASSLIVFIISLILIMVQSPAFPLAIPVLLLWLISPWAAHLISLPVETQRASISRNQEQELRKLARRTWLFFESYIGPEDHWLPPDHYQEQPRGLVAHRTSPTNIGLLLTATLGAYDLGYIGLLDLSLRLTNTFSTLKRLEKYRGHFLNWYDTRTLAPLPARYVSTVDSGNLAACFIVLKQACRNQLLQAPVLRWEIWEGVFDTLAVFEEAVNQLELDSEPLIGAITSQITNIRNQIIQQRHTTQRWGKLIEKLSLEDLFTLEQTLVECIERNAMKIDVDQMQSLRVWIERLRYHLASFLREVKAVMPWSTIIDETPRLLQFAELDSRLGQTWHDFLSILPENPLIHNLPYICPEAFERLNLVKRAVEASSFSTEEKDQVVQWCTDIQKQFSTACDLARDTISQFNDLIDDCESFTQETDFNFLFNPQRKIFRIGYNVDTGNRDPNYYDLLASEARIASIIAIGKGEVPQNHWLHLGRPLTSINGQQALLSWSGTMFEYLMPSLFMKEHPNTLLNQTNHLAVQRQIEYGQEHGIPWGISESGYYRFDANQNYQYRAFGTPGLGFKRGLEDDLVITPYASILALAFQPKAVIDNIRALKNEGMLRDYGFYESIDYTKRRLPLGKSSAIVRSYMAHHQGMILLSLVNSIDNEIMIHRFHSDPLVQSADLLLQEQIPYRAPVEPSQDEAPDRRTASSTQAVAISWPVPVHTPYPSAQVLSNGQFTTVVSSAGGGFSRWHEYDLTRWRADSTTEDWGMWTYIQDLDSGQLWSAGEMPLGGSVQHQEVRFSAYKVDFQKTVADITTHMEVAVAPNDDIEIRKIRITNRSDHPRRIRLSSYAEPVLAPLAADKRHPAFNKLFIESRVLSALSCLYYSRRQRASGDENIHLIHGLVTQSELAEAPSFESDRFNFIGRGRSIRNPHALDQNNGRLKGNTGAVLDPVMAIAQEVYLAPNATIQLAYITTAGESRERVVSLANKYQDWPTIMRVFDRARTQSEMEMRHAGLSAKDLISFQHLLSTLIYPQPKLRAPVDILAQNTRGQPALWPYAISGDYPILLVRLQSAEELPLVQDCINAFVYWRNRGVKIDLVILNEQESSYSQETAGQIQRVLSRSGNDIYLNQRGGIFVLRSDQVAAADLNMLYSSARAVLNGNSGTLQDQLADLYRFPLYLPSFTPTGTQEISEALRSSLPRPDGLEFDNGLGGFGAAGDTYQIYLEQDQRTPAPWSNIIANPEFGFLITETGSGYSWSENSGENRLTQWSNDPVTDPAAEALYIRDEETGEFWTPTPAPRGDSLPYHVYHGTGYTLFEHASHELLQQTRFYVSEQDPVKFIHLRVQNQSERSRRITVTYYTEWVLGVNRDEMQLYIIPDYDSQSQALMARNPYSPEFAGRVAFLAASKELHGLTTDRTEFIGRLRSVENPVGLQRIGLSETVAPGLDPCAVVQVHLDLPPGETEEVHFILGQAVDRNAALRLVETYQPTEKAHMVWQQQTDFWEELLGTVQVDTPEPSMNLMLNRWLLYQDLSCRIWGRSAFYQSSGAYGFRDQLQDVLAAIHAAPQVAREHILRAASHQFEAGDVLHWWHPPSGRGVRTRISDDLLWLPYVVAHYVKATGDRSILDEQVRFVEGEPLKPGEHENYAPYEKTSTHASVFEHCIRAIDRGATSGPHGIPLIGIGDWNDGMNRVGEHGKGESIWLGWFLRSVLDEFAELCLMEGQKDLAVRYQEMAQKVLEALENHGWDGDWYRRAYYDDGTPLGSVQNRECRIDAIAQSWSVLSNTTPTERSRRAMASVNDWLIKEQERLLLLFTPPFDETPRDPGYIKGYPPGIRENGGQYTHAAIWTVWAFAKLGDGDRAEALFRLLNPVLRSDTPDKVAQYFVEPYVIAADVYGVEPHTGRGGWTWYTGSGGWMYRLGLEAILGWQPREGGVYIDPCIPKSWKSYSVTYRKAGTSYKVDIKNPHGVNSGVIEVKLDDEILTGQTLPLTLDGKAHQVTVRLGNDLNEPQTKETES